MRLAASRDRETEQVGPFLCTFTSHTEMIYLNYAIPEDGAQPTAEEVAALVAAFEAKARTPRLEYIPTLSPAVEPALLAAGFEVEGTYPLMTYAADFATTAAPEGIEIVVASTDEDFLATLVAQYAAYEEAPIPGDDDVERLRNSVADGAIAVYARDIESGVPAGGGVCLPPYNGVTELAGIGVPEAFRRRGIAAATTARLVKEANAAGTGTVFLSAGGEEAERVYGRVGFRTVSSVVHISKPSAG